PAEARRAGALLPVFVKWLLDVTAKHPCQGAYNTLLTIACVTVCEIVTQAKVDTDYAAGDAKPLKPVDSTAEYDF
ncbi:hypothetical protein, partial [Microbulbifer elongatus]|uniref:hypothetical protein n=1 Tax=Microbulbifer elongatus TaxID=86173 RepID=UPI00210C11E0